MGMANKKVNLDQVPASSAGHPESHTAIRAAEPRGSDPGGPDFFDCITPVFSEAEVRDIMARASAAGEGPAEETLRGLPSPGLLESSATVVGEANKPAAEPPPAVQNLSAHGGHVSVMIWIAVGLTLVLMAATLFKAGEQISFHGGEPAPELRA